MHMHETNIGMKPYVMWYKINVGEKHMYVFTFLSVTSQVTKLPSALHA